MQEFIDYVEKQDYPRAISWCVDNMNKFSTLSAKYELMDIALMFDALCYDYLDSVWEYDELNRLMKEKYLRGQKDFTKDVWEKLEEFYKKEMEWYSWSSVIIRNGHAYY